MPHSCLRLGALGLLTAGTLGVSAHAHAAAAPRTAVLPIQVEGSVSDEWRPQFEEALGRGLTQGGLEVVDSAKVTEASGGVTTCANEKCFKFISSATDARFLVVSRLKVEDRNYEITLDIVDGEDGSLAASSSESCQVCGLGEVKELITRQAAALQQKVDALALEPAIVAFTSDPPGVEIFVDGKKIGVTPLEHELPPGDHKAEAKMDGYVDQTRTIHAVQGVQESLRFDLLVEHVTSDEGGDKGKDWKIPVGATLVGVGVASLAAGVTFLVIDERPYKSKCSGADVDADGNCRQRYNTLIHGASFTAVGGVLLISGAAMLIASRVKKGRGGKRASRRGERALAILGGRF